MKLIDLLVQELPKHGGWPDSAVECCRHKGTNSIDFYDSTGDWDDDCYLKYGKDFAKDCIYEPGEGEDRHLQSVKREQYEAALAASQQPVWNGKGLPPVGCECELYDCEDWQQVKIKYIGDKVVVVDDLANPAYGERVFHIAERPEKFRPLRTEAERKRDETVDLIMGWMHHAGRAEIELIYDHIATGKIPGVKLAD